MCGASRLALSHVVLPVLKANLVRMGDSLALQERQYFGPGLFVALPRVGVGMSSLSTSILIDFRSPIISTILNVFDWTSNSL